MPTNSPDDPARPTAQALPDGNPKTVYGAAKPSLSAIPPSALIHLGQAMAEGERKYGLFNYRDNNVTASVYYNAAMRHLLEYWDGENVDASGAHPLAHVMACCAIILDAELHKSLNDDRGPKGDVHQLITALTRDIAPQIKSWTPCAIPDRIIACGDDNDRDAPNLTASFHAHSVRR